MPPIKRIACIGSRQTPQPVLSWMEETAAEFVRRGYTIVSGNAPGADQAWARGGNRVDPRRVELCLPWEAFEQGAIHHDNVVRVFQLTKGEKYVKDVRANHPAFKEMTSAVVRLHCRNAMIVEGAYLVLGALNPDAPGGGGTGTPFRIAQSYRIETLNVADALVRQMISKRLLDGLEPRGPIFRTGEDA